MNCCNKEKENKNTNGNGHKKHISHVLMMVLCCGLPFILLLLLPLIGNSIPSARNTLGFVIPFLCPIMMGFMMITMFKKNKNKEEECEHENKKLDDVGNIGSEESKL